MTPLFVPGDAALAVVLGTALGLGLCLLISRTPRWGAPTLARRIAPYVRDISDPSASFSVSNPVRNGVTT